MQFVDNKSHVPTSNILSAAFLYDMSHKYMCCLGEKKVVFTVTWPTLPNPHPPPSRL